MNIKAILIPGVVGALIATGFAGWTFYSRYQSRTALEKTLEKKQVEAARRFREAYGSDDVRIAGFTIQPSQIRKGQEARFCYGVANAKVVRLDPPIDRVHPALKYCFDAAPKETTTFTLTAEDGSGKSVQEEATVTVK